MPALVATLLIFFAVSATSVASEDVNQKVEAYVNSIGDKVVAIVSSDGETKEDQRQRLEQLFEETVDIEWIARFVLPRHWRTLSDQQKTDYLKYYREQLIHNYVSKFENYQEGTEFKLLRVIPEMKNEYLATMKILRPGEAAIMAEYRVRDYGSEGYKVFDIIVEGASLISAQRSEYTSIANNKGVDYLIAQLALKEKESEASENSSAQ